MWCKPDNEKILRMSREDAATFIDGHIDSQGTLVGKDGRKAYWIFIQPDKTKSKWDSKWILDPWTTNDGTEISKSLFAWRVAKSRFFLPDLPAASLSSYEELSPTEKLQVTNLRRYWIGQRRFQRITRLWRLITVLLLGLPMFILSSVYLLGLERTPLTGRWRIILLTPEEEDSISTSLSGANWYRSVINLLSSPDCPAPPILPSHDWRWRWVQDTLCRLENATLQDSRSIPSDSPKSVANSTIPIPPVRHPLRPRPRISWMLHSMLPGPDDKISWEDLEMGPPYSLMLMEKEEENAFSYGFGGKGASGIVVFTGLLDDILRGHAPPTPAEPDRIPPSSPFCGLFSGLFGSTPSLRKTIFQPTEEQTLQLASVLAHEMGHLLLSHHIETLSQQQVLWPSILGLTMELTRAFIWPFT